MIFLESDTIFQQVFDDNLKPLKAEVIINIKDPKMSIINRFLQNKNVQYFF